MTAVLEDEFGDIIQKARQGRGLGIAELASRTGSTAERLSELESYEQPTEQEVQTLARELKLAPQKLDVIARDAWEPETAALEAAPAAPIHRITYKPWRVNCYVIENRSEQSSIVIDPGGQAHEIVQLVEAVGTPAGILLTHGHHDHTGAVSAVQKEFDCPVFIHSGDQEQLENISSAVVETIEEGGLELASLAVRVLHLPGHTPGSVVFATEQAVFTGDVLFAGSIGRVNQGPSYYPRLLKGVAEKIFELPGETLVCPGHGPPSTIDQERQHNPFFL
jgi:glyoxylase-like metal-dependent hydrolase (beta-lactamase superfamily II)